jgi:hypothetical protein
MIKDYEKYFGSVFTKIINFCDAPVSITRFPTKSNASFVINNKIGLYIKYSTKRLTPWQFSFLKEHQDEIQKMKDQLDEVFLVLVCHDNGIACLSFEELKLILDENHEDVEWIRVSRSKREKYSVHGKDGKLDFKIGNSDFPKKLFMNLDEEVKNKSFLNIKSIFGKAN